MTKQLLHAKALVVKESVGATQAGVIDQVIGSTPVLDRMGDTISQEGWDLKSFNDNPVILWGHNMDEERPPIAKALKVWIDGKGKAAKLMFRIQFDLADAFAADIYRKIKEGYVNTVSVGFLPTEWEELEPGNFWGGLKYTAQQLLELSFVPVPANPEALVGLRSFAKKDKRFTPIEENKLFAPIKNEKEIEEIFHVQVDKDGKTKAMDETGNITPDDAAAADENDMGYGKDTNIGDLTVTEARKEMDAAMEMCVPGSTKKDAEGTPNDPYHDLPGEADDVQMPAGDMMMKDLTVAHYRGMLQDIFGDYQSNLSTTSNQADNTDPNDLSFVEGEEKSETLRKAKGLVTMIEKAGRVLSKKNEEKIKQAIDQLNQVISELEADEAGDETGGKAVADKAVEGKGVIAYKDNGKAPESEAWDGPGERAKATTDDLKIMCAWYDETKADDKASYKLPHHKADGEHVAVWRGVTAAMATLMGSKGGIEIPEEDQRGVYNHLKKHYEEFGKDAPDFKSVENQILRGLDEELLAMTLEREEKHVVRLIKKVLENQKEEAKKEAKSQEPTLDAKALEVKVLGIFESALSKISSTKVEGGEK